MKKMDSATSRGMTLNRQT